MNETVNKSEYSKSTWMSYLNLRMNAALYRFSLYEIHHKTENKKVAIKSTKAICKKSGFENESCVSTPLTKALIGVKPIASQKLI